VNIVLAGGGTAGHIEPALNLADELTATDPTVKITVLGTSRGLEVDLVPAPRRYTLKHSVELLPQQRATSKQELLVLVLGALGMD
jgi:UDP-N-acetylglucosamine:LPS N-acetylglucosamine transferase